MNDDSFKHNKEDSNTSTDNADNSNERRNDSTTIIYNAILDYCKERLYIFAPEKEILKYGDYVITDTKYGSDIARITGKIDNVKTINMDEVVHIKRIATERDVSKCKENIKKAVDASVIFKEKVSDNKLNMKLVKTHFLVDEPKVIFFFSAENRIDFRKLVKDLVAVFKMRVELRQIGSRDEAKIIGGIGPCGRAFCCNAMADNLQVVSIKMAKEQGLSLNSTKISGQCGRLLCCLEYEQDWYAQAHKNTPPVGTMLKFNGVSYKVVDVNLITKKILISNSEGIVTSLYANNIKKENDKWVIKSMPSGI